MDKSCLFSDKAGEDEGLFSPLAISKVALFVNSIKLCKEKARSAQP